MYLCLKLPLASRGVLYTIYTNPRRFQSAAPEGLPEPPVGSSPRTHSKYRILQTFLPGACSPPAGPPKPEQPCSPPRSPCFPGVTAEKSPFHALFFPAAVSGTDSVFRISPPALQPLFRKRIRICKYCQKPLPVSVHIHESPFPFSPAFSSDRVGFAVFVKMHHNFTTQPLTNYAL